MIVAMLFVTENFDFCHLADEISWCLHHDQWECTVWVDGWRQASKVQGGAEASDDVGSRLWTAD